jgi:hypothetical protein
METAVRSQPGLGKNLGSADCRKIFFGSVNHWFQQIIFRALTEGFGMHHNLAFAVQPVPTPF